MQGKQLRKLESDLWKAADQLRANSKLTATENSMPVLELIFLRHSFNRFFEERERKKLIDQQAGAQKAAANLLNALQNLQTDDMNESGIKTWKKYSTKLLLHAEDISKSTDIELQRKQFKPLSSDLYKILKKLSANTSELYYQFCPMADDGNGAYWLSENSKIVNPYMGKKMLSCGSTKESLKGK